MSDAAEISPLQSFHVLVKRVGMQWKVFLPYSSHGFKEDTQLLRSQGTTNDALEKIPAQSMNRETVLKVFIGKATWRRELAVTLKGDLFWRIQHSIVDRLWINSNVILPF